MAQRRIHTSEIRKRHESLAGRVARQRAAAMLEGRVGHGGGPCTRRVLRQLDLEQFAMSVIAEYLREVIDLTQGGTG